MSSKAGNRSRPSNDQRSQSYNDEALRRPRVRALSDRARHDGKFGAARSPGFSGLDRGAADSYFQPTQRKTGTGNAFEVQETDDFGYALAGPAQSPTSIDAAVPQSSQLVKARCRVCDAELQVPVKSSAKCEQCFAFNTLDTNTASAVQGRIVSLARAKDITARTIADGLKKLDQIEQDAGIITPSRTRTQEDRDVSPSRKPLPPRPGQLRPARRRGSAPDALLRPSRSRSPQKSGLTPGATAKDRVRSSNGRGVQRGLPIRNNPRRDASPDLPSQTAAPVSKLPAQIHPATQPNMTSPIRTMKHLPMPDSFRPIFELMASSLTRSSLNVAFSTLRGPLLQKSSAKPADSRAMPRQQIERRATPPPQISQMDHKNLMVGDVYDVASSLVTDASPAKRQVTTSASVNARLVSQHSAHIDWAQLNQWYRVFISIGLPLSSHFNAQPNTDKDIVDDEVLRLRALGNLGFHIRAAILRFMEELLLRPQIRPQEPEDIRYLLILLANPLILHSRLYPVRSSRRRRSTAHLLHTPSTPAFGASLKSVDNSSTLPSKVFSLLLGTIASLPSDCLRTITGWLARYSEVDFRSHVDALLGFINERIALFRTPGTGSEKRPLLNHHGIPASQMFNDVLNAHFDADEDIFEDWQLKSACKVLQLFVRANDHFIARAPVGRAMDASERRRPTTKQLIPTEHFYVSQLDDKSKFDPRKDFNDWERKEQGLQLSQFPFLMTLGTKITILEFDARRKMETKARQEFFDSIMRHTAVDKNFHLKIRRQCIVEDSLQRISEAVNSSEGEAKKALKVHFDGEDGVDAGGLRKEWFLLLMKELLDPNVGLFIYNEETNYCYFNPLSLESTEQYQLVGAVLGLAIYNFTILDTPFPPFLFRKLVAAAPQIKGFDIYQGWKPVWRPTLVELGQFDPILARNLQYILDYEGDLAEEVCATFDVDIAHHGLQQKTTLHSGDGEKIVDNENRAEYVRQYVDFILDRSVRKQFEAFARGFFNVCWGNALSLFRGEEIELLIRGSSELDFSVLRGSATYENWRPSADAAELTSTPAVEAAFPVVRWFWELMQHADVADQRRVLRWITGSDRVPATGMGSLVLRIQRLGDDCARLPQCRTCFNTLQLWNYGSRRVFVNKFWYAVVQSGEGFGLK